MSPISTIIWAALFAMALSSVTKAQAQVPGLLQPAAKALGIKVPGKVDAVFLSGNREMRIVQITFPPVQRGQRAPERKHPATQVWLLKADGTAIEGRRLLSPVVSMAGSVTASDVYGYEASAAAAAVAVVVSIDDEFFIERLRQDGK